jgi:hypothetical protein
MITKNVIQNAPTPTNVFAGREIEDAKPSRPFGTPLQRRGMFAGRVIAPAHIISAIPKIL